EVVWWCERALLYLLAGGGRLLGIDRVLCLLDQREDVAHPEDPSRHPIRVERLEVIQSLAGTGEEDGPAGHRGHRQGGPATSVPVELREDEPRRVDVVHERTSLDDRILPGHRVALPHDVR